MEDALILYEASRWLWIDSTALAHHSTRVLVRLDSDRAYRAINARLLYPQTPYSVVAAVAGAATSLGSQYAPPERVVRHLFTVWRRTGAGGIYSLLQRGAEHLDVPDLHAALEVKERHDDALRLLVLTRHWTAFSVALRHLTREPLDLTAFDFAEFSRIQHPAVQSGDALLELLEGQNLDAYEEQQLAEAFAALLPAPQARRGLERIAASEGVAAEAARAALGADREDKSYQT